jgi:epoxide hydrolase 4
VPFEQTAPLTVPEVRGVGSGVNDVGEEHGGENTVGGRDAPPSGEELRDGVEEVFWVAERQEALSFYALYRSPRAEEVLSRNGFAVMCSWFGDVLTEADLAVYKEAWLQPGALTGMLNWYRAADLGPPDPGRGRPEDNGTCGLDVESLTVSVPTLVIWGEKSLLPMSLLEGLEAYVPNLSMLTLPGGSHWLPEEQPDEINGSI